MTDDELDMLVRRLEEYPEEAMDDARVPWSELCEAVGAITELRNERDSARAEVEKLRAALEEAVLYTDDCLSQETAMAFKEKHGIGETQ